MIEAIQELGESVSEAYPYFSLINDLELISKPGAKMNSRYFISFLFFIKLRKEKYLLINFGLKDYKRTRNSVEERASTERIH
ncbi:MAG: hypothetical protein IPJ03_18355 [Ignavibacteriales bacterium]|nr:hypothetical protein [Ignavibacteriales bacterium]